MRELKSEGKSYTEIAQYLNENKIPTRHTRKDKQSDWYSTTVRNILLRPGVSFNEEEDGISESSKEESD